jgi:hypothetical protein
MPVILGSEPLRTHDHILFSQLRDLSVFLYLFTPGGGGGYFTTDWQSVCLDVGHRFEAHDQISHFPFFCRVIALRFVLGLPLWREDGSVICSAICQWSESRRTHIHALLSPLRLLGSLSVASYDSQGLRWKYSYPPPHGDLPQEPGGAVISSCTAFSFGRLLRVTGLRRKYSTAITTARNFLFNSFY